MDISHELSTLLLCAGQLISCLCQFQYQETRKRRDILHNLLDIVLLQHVQQNNKKLLNTSINGNNNKMFLSYKNLPFAKGTFLSLFSYTRDLMGFSISIRRRSCGLVHVIVSYSDDSQTKKKKIFDNFFFHFFCWEGLVHHNSAHG